MATVTVTKENVNEKLKPKSKNLKKAVNESDDLDKVLKKVEKIDYICAYGKCKSKTEYFAITCKFCNSRFCTVHGLPEVHGCGEAVRREERRAFVHPIPKASHEQHEKASTKLTMKLKQMQLERKSKPGGKKK